MTSINSQLQAIHTRIQSVRADNGCPQPVYVLAVSKSKPAAAVREAYIAGQTMFGENYLQEALEKQAQLTDLPIEWHFIGPIQSNKTQAIAHHFSWVHSVDRLKIAQRLNDARPIDLPPLQICIQVNISHEES
ncbi:MAG TPA: YggS family pyridoxal phosphate-dependent enzyme, partial [Methylotenera sp.]|nr:YggS family pyridoxal phosphate-dependent enzyme [Methylotenera sp.]